MGTVGTVIAVVVAYFCGTIPTAIIVARSKGVDITSFGSGNPGASNVGRALGTRYFVLVMVVDAAKGGLPTALLLGDRPVAYACGAAAIIGHVFPVTRRFRGGKGIATGAGVVLAVQPLVMLAALVSWLAVLKLSKKASVASIVAVPVVVVGFVVSGSPGWELWSIVGLSLLVEIRHVSNIKRLLQRSEPTISNETS